MVEIYRVLRPDGRLLVVDLKRFEGFFGHIQMTLFFHGAPAHGIEDPPRLMQPVGFKPGEQGGLGVDPIGYAKASR